MDQYLNLWEESLRLCEKLKEHIEWDCNVDINKIGGNTLTQYERLRKKQLEQIEDVYNKLKCVQMF